VKPARLQPSRAVRSNIGLGRSCSSSSGAGPMPPMNSVISSSVEVMLSGCAGQPGMQTIGSPVRDVQPQPR